MALGASIRHVEQQCSNFLAAIGGPTRTQRAATLAFAALAALDTLGSPQIAIGSWWLVLLLVWVMPWPSAARYTSANPKWPNVLRPLLVLGVLAWLYLRWSIAARNVTEYWFPFVHFPIGVRFLSSVTRDALISLTGALLIGPPVYRAFGRYSVLGAVLVTLPFSVCATVPWFYDAPLSIVFSRYFLLTTLELLLCTLVLMEVCALLVRHKARSGDSGPPPSIHTQHRVWPRSRALRIGVTIGVFAFALMAAVRYVMAPINSGHLGTVLFYVDPALPVLLTATLVWAFRSIRASTDRSGRLHRLVRTAEWPVGLLVLSPFWIWSLLHAAPISASATSDRLQFWLNTTPVVTCDERTRIIAVNSGFTSGLAERFRQVLDSCPMASTVRLSSAGGSIREGHEIASLIKKHQLATLVVDSCRSACTYAFLAGHPRTLDEGAKLGFHSSRELSPLLQWLDPSNGLDDFSIDQGVDVAFLRRAASVPHDTMWYPTRAELLAAGYVTEIRP